MIAQRSFSASITHVFVRRHLFLFDAEEERIKKDPLGRKRRIKRFVSGRFAAHSASRCARFDFGSSATVFD